MIKETNIPDAEQRELALAPSGSFIVQAPAGSGKTTLLTQRFLSLLGNSAKKPEEILAITFTRKAAAEMRTRIVDALQNAATQPMPAESFTQKTYVLAQQVLEKNKDLNWNLLDNPNRLQIKTIDSLCASISEHMPLSSRFGAFPKITDDPYILYKQAADNLLLQIDNDVLYATTIAQLLSHLDNNFVNARILITKMLAKRDQWLPHVHNQKISREELEKGLKEIHDACFEKLEQTSPKELMAELDELATFAQENVTQSSILNPQSSLHWRFIPDLLLTSKDEWRTKVTKKIGFPAPSSFKDKEEKTFYANMKQRMEELLNDLKNHDAFRAAIIELKNIPPTSYTDEQWQIVSALTTLLPIAAAHLKLIFRETNEVDFIEISQAAAFALGQPENPTNFALMLDYKINHLLIDEFQDTSTTQYRLLEQLTSGWEQNDGRTLFLVGDPMQSIYRFRDAEVGLFLQVKNDGVNNLQLTPLTLSVNFRSDKKLIDWFNNTFVNIFPSYEDINTGAVTYTASTATHNNDDANIVVHTTTDSDAQTQEQSIATLINDLKQQNPEQKIAILIKARNHLNKILQILRKHKVDYQAIEIDKLNTKPIILDLLALTKAILHPADRIAWLSILRAPWCQLSLVDLHTIASEQKNITIWERINNQNVINQLNTTTKPKLESLIQIIADALQNRGRQNLRTLIEHAWTTLHAPSFYTETDHKDAKAFFELLEQLETGGDIKDFANLETKVNQLYASPNETADDAVQVMTIYKAKGLEFDTVILPELQRIPPKHDQQLFLWNEQQDSLVLAPIKATGDDIDPIYSYLSRKDNLKSKYENMRLLYVAATRAKKQLHLFGEVIELENGGFKKPILGSFLRLLWPVS